MDTDAFRSALEEQLLGAVQGHHGLSNPARPDHSLPAPSIAHHHNNIDPAIAGPGMVHSSNSPTDMGHESPTDGRKGKRELSTSKRAAQNRAAQVSESMFH